MTQAPNARRALVARYATRCACGTVLPEGTTVYWAPGLKAVCGLCHEKGEAPVAAPLSAPDGDDLANLGLDALTEEALVFSRAQSNFYDATPGAVRSASDNREWARIDAALHLVDQEIAKRKKLLRPVQPEEVARFKRLSDALLAQTIAGLQNDRRDGTTWSVRVDDGVRLAVALAIQLEREQRPENQQRYDERAARVEADDAAGRATPTGVYAELLVLAKRLGDEVGQEVWTRELRKAVR
jgi:hypothetical protein